MRLHATIEAGSGQAGIVGQLRAQLLTHQGGGVYASLGSPIAAGFAEDGDGNYTWDAEVDAFDGKVCFSNAVTGLVYGSDFAGAFEQVGPVQLDLTQPVPTSNAAETIGDALNAARAQAFGAWTIVGTVLTLFAADGVTAVRTFALDAFPGATSRS